VTDPLASVRDHLRDYFTSAGVDAEPLVASVTFLGVERIDVLRFGPDQRRGRDGVFHYISVGCARYPMTDAASALADPIRGPRAEITMSLRDGAPADGLARSLAVVAATPVVDGVVLGAGPLVDLSGPLWTGAPFTAVLLSESEIPDLPLDPPREPVQFLSAVPITQTEGAWVRLKGAEAMRQAWADDGVDVLDPLRSAARR
jgi:hypothetical protein